MPKSHTKPHTTLASFLAAVREGKIDANRVTVIVDNDCSYAYLGNQEVFQGEGPEELAIEALQLLGLKAERP